MTIDKDKAFWNEVFPPKEESNQEHQERKISANLTPEEFDAELYQLLGDFPRSEENSRDILPLKTQAATNQETITSLSSDSSRGGEDKFGLYLKDQGESDSTNIIEHFESTTPVINSVKTADPSKKRLGRGLASLIGVAELELIQKDNSATKQGFSESLTNNGKGEAILSINIDDIVQNDQNPRHQFSQQDLDELALSIKEHGLLQPILVRPFGQRGQYQIIAGERRWRAAKQIGVRELPAIIRTMDDKKALEVALIENVQRSDLNPLEEAKGYKQLIEEFHYKQEDLAQILGKSRSHLANMLRLLKLPEKVQTMLSEAKLSYGHARALINAPDSITLADYIVAEGLSVRETEALVQEQVERLADMADSLKKTTDRKKQKQTNKRDLHKERVSVIAKFLSDRFHFKVSVQHRPNEEKGVLKIAYSTLEELEQFYQKITMEKEDQNLNKSG